nr:nuclear transport factor 2 family protein [Acidimicrobiia bacterium]
MRHHRAMANDARAWLDRYFEAWRTNDPGLVAALFAEDALYAVDPFAPPWKGRREIVERWTAGAGQLVGHRFQILSMDFPTVAHWWVEVGEVDGTTIEMDGILVLEFNDSGECTSHREWYSIHRNPQPSDE